MLCVRQGREAGPAGRVRCWLVHCMEPKTGQQKVQLYYEGDSLCPSSYVIYLWHYVFQELHAYPWLKINFGFDSVCTVVYIYCLLCCTILFLFKLSRTYPYIVFFAAMSWNGHWLESTMELNHKSGLGLRSFDFQANRLFFVQKWAN